MLEEEVLFALDQLFGERLISEFKTISVRTLASEIVTRRNALIPQSVTSIDLASELLGALRKLEFIDSTQAESQAPPVTEDLQRREDKWYRQQLQAAANRSINSAAGSINVGPAVYESLMTMAGSISMRDTIVLDTVSTMAGSIRGNAFVVRDTEVSSMAGSITADIKVLSWADLYKKAIKLGILEA